MGYADNKYHVVERKWFGLTKIHGGDCAAGYTFGTTDATSTKQLVRYYPKGPIRLLKAGHYVIDTIAGGGTDMDVIPARLLVNGGAEATWNIPDGGAVYSIASTVTFTNPVVDSGSYIGITTGTPQSGDGTAANTATTTGTVAFFIDYTREFTGADTNWNKGDY